MTDTMSHEARVRNFYHDGPGGEAAGQAYSALMGDVWHHGDNAAEKAGKSPLEAAMILEQRLTNLAGIKPGDRVLDFGSGPGGATCAMAIMTGAVFVGLSNTETLSQRARALAEQRDLADRVSFLTVGDTDYRTLTAWPDHSFDAVTFFESVCHLSDKEAFFRAAHRVLRPGGRLVGLDWLQRPFGEHQSPEQIEAFIGAVCEHIRLADLGTLDGYAAMMREAGFTVTHAVDEFAGEPCWGSTPPEDREKWLTYTSPGPAGDLFVQGKRALDAARGAGVFTVGWWAAAKGPAE
ncbi:SAM-dependent methyltransferase [Rhizomonospora bruguierae]|uniref:SAM-dependent methyltransferase n=1 Tax=Rhizomonospora bruguierae TaxID=1581705 RepID=UPI001BCB0B45|nr:class I SAM-dependent methyltransferase [Micromonospora sp. NBRC 107566]